MVKVSLLSEHLLPARSPQVLGIPRTFIPFLQPGLTHHQSLSLLHWGGGK